MSITVAKTAGFCFGVRRAVKMAINAEPRPIYCAGPLIHNDYVIKELARQGIITCEKPEDIPDGARVIIRAHGLPVEDKRLLEGKGCHIIDATCPDVAKIHRIAAEQSEEGRLVLILGKANHPEVMGIRSRCKMAEIAENCEDLLYFVQGNANKNISVVCQTTLNRELCQTMINTLKKTCKDLRVFDTICMATERHQSEAAQAAKKSDAVVVIGDKKSSNSKNLYELCKQYCNNTFFIEGPHQLDIAVLQQYGDVFITAGASTPDRIIEEVYDTMTEEMNATTTTATTTESFEEMLEQSLKSNLHTGDKVTGVVTQIGATEISVDLGVKQAGFIPVSDLSDDPTYVVADNIKVGDEIEAMVVHISDVEGLIRLSKKRVDAKKNWELLENAVESKEAFEGIIIEQNKGGVVALVKDIRVFIPASQTGLPREASFDSMIKTRQKVRITEVNGQRRRVVGSIKAVLADSRKEAQEKIWTDIEIGKHYNGVVKSFTTYGAFIDIGGVDGMVHISELSWNRVKHPSEVLEIGQEVEVFVIALDHEKKKISLGYRKSEENPWTKFETTYNVGDVIPVKIVKFMPFGAFAEVIPGVDGLIHISQIDADRRIGKPDEVLTIGETVEVKIVGIDQEKKKISLSIRALIDQFYEMPGEEAEETEE